MFGLWPLELRQDLKRWMADSDTMKVFAWASRHDLAYCDFEASGPDAPDPFFNANTPEDLAEAEAYASRLEAGA